MTAFSSPSEALSEIWPDAFYFDMTSEAVIATRSTHLRAIVTRLFAWLVVVAGLLVVGQALVRRTVLASTDDPILRALGMSRETNWSAGCQRQPRGMPRARL